MKYALVIICVFWLVVQQLLAQGVDPPQVQFVSINPYDNTLSVAWSSSANTNISFIRVHYVYDKIPPIKGQTVEDIFANTDDTLTFSVFDYSIFSTQVNEAPLSFAVDAYTIGNENSATLDQYHTTMILSHEVLDCAGGVALSWTAYEGYNVTILGYTIFEVIGTNDEIELGTVSASQTSFIVPHSNVETRRFFIQARIRHSNFVEYTPRSAMTEAASVLYTYPQYVYIESLAVDTANQVLLTVAIDANSDFSSFRIERSLFYVTDFVPYDTVHVPKSQTSFVYTDSDVLVADSVYYYRVYALDNCGNAIFESNILAPLALFVQEASLHEHVLSWSVSDNVSSLLSSFELYRITNNTEYTLVETLSSSEFSALDEIRNFSIDPRICYKILARQTDTVPYLISSNYACVQKNSTLFVPTAFNPFSAIEENRVFKPKYAYVAGDYVLQVFNRTGAKIFESRDITVGWNGMIGNSYAPEGAYLFAIQVNLPGGTKIREEGMIKLLLQD